MLPRYLLPILCFTIVACQDNAGRNIAEPLKECYNDTYLNDRNNRLPLTINVLIDLIRRIEDGKSTQDARNFAIELIHLLRQDGIVELDSKNRLSLPFSPDGYQADRNRLLLQTFIPGTAINFPNDTLNSLEKCSLHFMLSNSFETKTRSDESMVCNRIGRYRMKIKRSIAANVEAETFTPNRTEVETRRPLPRGYDNSDVSDCPVENGVVYTKWGSIQAGNVLAAIAAGTVLQSIKEDGYECNSLYAATVAGDIAETALQQGVKYDEYFVGSGGGWKSEMVPRWYFITMTDRQPLRELTDAEIRGDLDGLIIGSNVDDWRKKISSLKISQILDMYYSKRGAFSSNIKACMRNEHATKYVAESTITDQSLGFAALYNRLASVKGTLENKNLPVLIEKTVSNFLQYYVNLKSRDLSCDATDDINRIATEITIVLDFEWPYDVIYPSLSYLLDNLDINKYESNYTLINAKDGSLIVDNSNSIIDFHEVYNKTIHDRNQRGLDLVSSFGVVEDRLKARVNQEKFFKKTSGKSMIVLLVPYSSSIGAEQENYIREKIDTLMTYNVPDLKVMVLGSGNKEDYNRLVNNNNDVYTLPQFTSDEKTLITALQPLTARISKIPRRLSNPICGENLDGELSTNSVELYVEPGNINYYKISPNYFQGSGEHRVTVRAQWDSVTVCQSRSEPRPNNQLGNECTTINTQEHSIDLKDDCTDAVNQCSPLYFSVAGPANSSNPRCSDIFCRYPDNVKFVVTTHNFVCKGGSVQMVASLSLLLIPVYVLFNKLA